MSVMQVTVDHCYFRLNLSPDVIRNLSLPLPTIPILARTSHGKVPHITERTYLVEEDDWQKLVGRTGPTSLALPLPRSRSLWSRTATGRNEGTTGLRCANPCARLGHLKHRTGVDTRTLLLSDRIGSDEGPWVLRRTEHAHGCDWD